ncbi:MAG: PAS domain-containing protein, partial [Armatimonadetes bacterium]|nr:PAS domain-containing protein [Armatimonadota bacterium]NIM23767.1 PAS domain-containing protein [Armatimonadota bacterium]NIM67644.1 PAS domain-containing protein [Armatimonadota bacterium]NIM76160.1 PAS domain-containing protein [Armatimonadota bacterium]NIN05845.1 PAS domain-containing protein [Armatimonadota bacterium]
HKINEYTQASLSAQQLRFDGAGRTLGGRPISVEVEVSALCDEEGRPHSFVAILRDISPRERGKERLQHSAEILHAVIENIGIGISLISPKMQILELNRAMREWFPEVDVTRKPLCYRAFNDPPREGPCSYCPTIKTLRDGQVHEAITETPAGSRGVVNYRIVSTAIRDTAGEIVGAVEMVEDVTKRRRAEDERIRAVGEALFKSALLEAQSEASIDGILVVDADAKMLSFNQRFVEMWGIPKKVIDSRSDEQALKFVLDKLEDPAGFLARVQYLYAHPEEKSLDEIHLRDGRVFDRYSAPVTGPDHTYYGRVWYFRDITERKRFEQALRAKNRELESFVYTASHDLRSPLVGMQGFADLLFQDYYDKLDERGREYIDYIRANTNTMSALLTDLLELSRIGREEEQEENVNVGEVVSRVLEDLNAMIEEADAEVKVAKDLPTVRYPHTRLYQVFSNLITNAVKFSREDVKPKVEVGWEPLKAGYRFFIEDNGIGIDEENFQNIFELFSRLKIKDVEGTGIGLAIVKKIVESHGGEAGVESDPGKGSTFWFTVPSEEKEDA